MNNPLISIIVPIYNSEKYLERCISSIIQQTYSNLEIILIDDGSTDKSAVLCDSYQSVDNRVKVVHQSNQGVGITRNVGIHIAKGQYVGFVDSDDYIAPNMYESLMQTLLQYNLDIVSCSYFFERKGNAVYEGNSGKEIVLSPEIMIHKILVDKEYKNNFWNRVYKKELFDNLSVPNCRHLEDVAIMPIIYSRVQRCACIERPLYYHSFNRESLMCDNTNKVCLFYDAICAYEIRQEMISGIVSAKAVEYAQKALIKCCVKHVCHRKEYPDNFLTKRAICKSYQLLDMYGNTKLLPLDYKIKYIIVMHNRNANSLFCRLLSNLYYIITKKTWKI